MSHAQEQKEGPIEPTTNKRTSHFTETWSGMSVTENAEQWLREELHDQIEHLQSVEARQRL